MSKNEFLRKLEEALTEQMDVDEAAEHVRYYQNYIEKEVSNGKTEEEVVDSLSGPRLVAKNIINNSASARKYKSDYSAYSDKSYEKTKGDGVSFSINGKTINPLIMKIIFVAVLIVIVVLALFIIKVVSWLLMRFILPGVLVIGAIYIIMKVFRNGR